MSATDGSEALRTTAAVRREIERAREDVAITAVALRRRVEELTSFHEWVDRHPFPILGAAFALGFILGRR